MGVLVAMVVCGGFGSEEGPRLEVCGEELGISNFGLCVAKKNRI